MKGLCNRSIGAVAASLPLLLGACDSHPSSFPPAPDANILLVTLDTVRADRIGVYGFPEANTPTIDALAREGILFERALAATPITLPSHASILTGLYPHAHGVRDNGLFTLGLEATLVSEVLAEAGWRTGAFVGSAVLDPRYGLDQGFEVYGAPPSFKIGGKPERPADVVVDEALAWVEEIGAEEKFFLWVHFYDPHKPHEPPEHWQGRTPTPYDGEISFCDEQLDRLLRGLRGHGSAPLLVALTADHGEAFGEHGEWSHGILLHQPTLRVPLILSGEVVGRARGARIASPVSHAALAPTLLEIAGLPPAALPDVRLSPLLDPTRRAIYVESHLPHYLHGWRAQRGVVWDHWELIEGSPSALFDLQRDPQELEDRASTDAGRVRELEGRLQAILAEHPPLGWADQATFDATERAALEALGYVAQRRGGDPYDPALADPRSRVEELVRVTGEATAVLNEWISSQGFSRGPDEWQLRSLRPRLLEARDRLRELEIRNPGNLEVLSLQGSIEVCLGHYAAAAILLEQARALSPSSIEIRYNLALAHAGTGETEKAKRAMHQIVADDPRYLLAPLWLAVRHEERGEWGHAAGWLVHAMEALDRGSAERRELQVRLDSLSREMRSRGQEIVLPALGDGGRASYN